MDKIHFTNINLKDRYLLSNQAIDSNISSINGGTIEKTRTWNVVYSSFQHILKGHTTKYTE